ncbi:NADP-dependent oxidoreductase [Amycolatopsis mongoliensis]|uniref:NADP-dependent oxidoreductase n=1 Tax=Amycolatopsis mongoliensis TaxID=715475 RepID=A0A9Y2JMU5_9PSEU|nr:NADP-dependent oxidoreductase [Amycolatopsis sp. 4-36]WIY01408.1 NADP-dependent oxidoreductase [Amycolatopsis sp. 4-36]
MFAARFERFGPPGVLSVGELPEPHAGPGEVRVRVRAAGVSPVDLAIRAGKSRSPVALPHIPGVDAAGVVDEAGPGAAVGDEVFGTVDLARLGGATAEFAVLAFWAPKPASMPWEQAGAAGSGIETATRALDLLDVRDGMTLLVDGASGGVGSLVVGLALARGARVIGTAGDLEFVERLGATPVSYGPGLPARVSGGVDAALDVAGRGSLPELVALTGSPSSVLTLADFSGPAQGVRVSVGALGGEPDGRHGLALAAGLFEEGRFRVPVEEVFTDAAAAHAAAERGPRRGKLVVAVSG